MSLLSYSYCITGISNPADTSNDFIIRGGSFMARIFYTAVGHFRRRNDGHGNIYPIVFVNRQEYLLDPQEMTVWTILN